MTDAPKPTPDERMLSLYLRDAQPGEDDATRTEAVQNLLFLYRAQHKTGHVDIRLKIFFDQAARSIWLSEKAGAEGRDATEWVDPRVALARLLRGAPRRGAREKSRWRNIEIAAEVKVRMNNGVLRDDAIEEVCQPYHLSFEAVRDIYQNSKDALATKALVQLKGFAPQRKN
jgi:hypothetical protein